MPEGRRSRWLKVVSGVLLAGAAYYFGTGLDAIGALVWVAPLPVLIPAFTLGTGQAAVLALGASLLGGLNMVSYLAAIVPKPVVAAALLIPAIAYAGSILLARRAARILPPALSVLAFPVAWTSYEYLLSVVSPHGTAGSLAYTQTWLPLIQLASMTGMWGITSVITLVPAGIAVAWYRRTLVPLAIPLAFAAAALLFGWGRLAIPNDRPIIRVGLTATDETVSCFGTNRSDQALPVISAYARRIGQLASRGAQVVLLPEKFVGIASAYAADATGILGTAASSGKVTVIAGLNEVGVRPMRNTAVVFSPDGHILASYDKIHLLPGPETGYLAGKDIALFSLCGATAGVAVCKDMDFPGLGRRYSRAGAGILFVPAWDFVRDAQLHARMAIMRAVESGFALARSAQQGLVTVADHRGRVLAETRSPAAGEALLLARISPGPARTFYSMTGDWFAWLNIALLGTAAAFLKKNRGAPS